MTPQKKQEVILHALRFLAANYDSATEEVTPDYSESEILELVADLEIQQATPPAQAKSLRDLTEKDAVGNLVEMTLFHVTEGDGSGSILAIDASFLDQAADAANPEDPDGPLLIPNPFSPLEAPSNILLTFE